MENTSVEYLVSREPLWKVCEPVYEAFEKCKMENGDDPEKCLNRSTAVVGCATKVMREISSKCKSELDAAVKNCENNNNRTIGNEKEEAALTSCFDSKVFPKFC
ncbi:hypothetical protein DICPUDRAFT_147508 [Dictyostelium purpureum]|uniref:IMS import disulfide relay-system CHCH-CHCH-like Cx9C domain-containing protein n=1 Tax=Dictyostelium purpureum TaxID=5786 RepID=F0Z8N5_DICPU|nr:uncharacterized protein DICPUDRAFT_147508 [Dictyostelium purpureum]EGC39686.1 hypothetical protein DICPUDRAFT_147508 [Dictyostelium purpureum]|eukprot:XP_003283795.1 hypothetical protein DICPUDRAFT_147508 [Dictyostelium purpureum]